MASAIKSGINVAMYPLKRVGTAVHSRAVMASRFQEPAVAAQVEAYEATGVDLAAECTRDFVTLQFKLLPYRVTKFKQELDCLLGEGSSLSNYTYKNWVIFVRFCCRVTFLFMVGVMCGRHSIYPRMLPDSPFAKEAARRFQA